MMDLRIYILHLIGLDFFLKTWDRFEINLGIDNFHSVSFNCLNIIKTKNN